MKNFTLTLLTTILSITFLFGQKSDLAEFESFLGKEKSAVLNQMNKSFEFFLKSNFPDIKDENERIYQFLEGFKDWSNLEKDWEINFQNARKTLNQFENSGLRIDYWIHGYETYKLTYQIDSFILPQEDTSSLPTISSKELYLEDTELFFEDIDDEIIPKVKNNYDPEIEKRLQRQRDSLQSINIEGKLFYGLLKYGQNDSLIKSHLEAIYFFGDGLYTPMEAIGIADQNLDLSTPLRKRLIVLDFFYHFLKWNLENKKTTR